MQPIERPPHLIAPDEVASWLADSAVENVTLHCTSRAAADRIRRLGADPEWSHVGAFGAGFYTATIEEELHGPARVVVAIRLLAPLIGRFSEIEEIVDRLATRLNPPGGEISTAVAAQIRRELLDLGYDGIIVHDGGGDGVDWVIALMGDAVRVVDE